MKISKIGLVLALIYLILLLACVVWAFTVTDPKGKFVILQLPLAIQMAGLDEIGILKYFTDISWTIAYVMIGIPTLLIYYCIGCILDKVFSRK